MSADRIVRLLTQRPSHTATVKELRETLGLEKSVATRALRSLTNGGHIERDFEGGVVGGRHIVRLVSMPCTSQEKDHDECDLCQGTRRMVL